MQSGSRRNTIYLYTNGYTWNNSNNNNMFNVYADSLITRDPFSERRAAADDDLLLLLIL